MLCRGIIIQIAQSWGIKTLHVSVTVTEPPWCNYYARNLFTVLRLTIHSMSYVISYNTYMVDKQAIKSAILLQAAS